MKYLGYKCPVCEKLFAEGDDVVVCPVCGAPHHRQCYKERGGCALEQLHAEGKAWSDHVRAQGPAPQPEPDAEGRPGYGQAAGQTAYSRRQSRESGAVQTCPSCGSSNPSDGIFCQVCGTLLNRQAPPGGYPGPAAGPGRNPYNQYGPSQPGGGYQAPPGAPGGYGPTPPGGYGQAQGVYNDISSPYAGLSPEEKINGVTVKELATYIGPSSRYYLPRFKVLQDNGGRALLFCWSAFLFNFMYFFYRKMYKIAIPLLILFAFTMVPTLVYSFEYVKEAVAQYGQLTLPLPLISTPALDRLASIVTLLRFFQFGVGMVLGFTANRLYLRECCGRIRRLQEEHKQTTAADTGLYIQQLAVQGGVSTTNVALLAGVLIVCYFLVTYLMSYSILS